MPRPRTRAKLAGPKVFARHPDQNPLPPAVRELLDDDAIDPELFTAVCTAFVRARAAGEDVSEPTTAAWIVGLARAEVAEKRADGNDPFAAA